ncbi:MAG: hypothetical protein K0R05_973 [Anaerocolumna sp.]|jgi:DNA helicase-4|nr:hypothetical protein [Anaerocolumna sp.]
MEKFDCLGDCYDYYRNADFKTLKGKVTNIKEEVEYIAADLKVRKYTLQGETVKSLEEVMIANFLFLNGISYEYEKRYPYDSGDINKKAYYTSGFLSNYAYKEANRSFWANETSYYDYYPYDAK